MSIDAGVLGPLPDGGDGAGAPLPPGARGPLGAGVDGPLGMRGALGAPPGVDGPAPPPGVDGREGAVSPGPGLLPPGVDGPPPPRVGGGGGMSDGGGGGGTSDGGGGGNTPPWIAAEANCGTPTSAAQSSVTRAGCMKNGDRPSR